jgi:predicted phage-related endonuclease
MNALIEKIRDYREYKRMIEELQNLADSIADDLKNYMTESGQQKIIIGEYKMSYTEHTRTDLDKKALADDYNEIYNDYLIETNYKRFQVW